jgi:tetratricopeptide (TPR) repeat protein
MGVNWGGFQPQAASEKKPIQKIMTWAKTHQEIIAASGIFILLLGIGIPYYFHSKAQSEKEAMGVLNLGQWYLHSPVDPKNGPFKTPEERDQQALQAFQRITNDYKGTYAAKIARFYMAKCQFSLRLYPQAYVSFDETSLELKDAPIGAEAYLGKILCLEAQSQWTQAATLLESYLKAYPDSFLAPEIHLNLSEVYLKNQNKDKALEQLKLVAKKYADSNWGREAQRRLKKIEVLTGHISSKNRLIRDKPSKNKGSGGNRLITINDPPGMS